MPLAAIVGAAIERVCGEGRDPEKTFFFIPTIPMACNMPQFPIFAEMAFRAAGIGGIRIGRINFMALGDTLPKSLAIKLLESYIVACILYKLQFRIRPYEKTAGDTDRAFGAARALISDAIRAGADLRMALGQAAELFRVIPRDETGGRKPRIALLGDLYVKYNEVVNEGIQSTVEALQGELVVSSMSEYALHFFDIDVRRYGGDDRSYRLLRTIEGRFESIVRDLIEDQVEPGFAECARLMEKYGLRHYLPGETSINVGKALWLCENRSVEAIIHANPLFCCPGVVTASLFRKIQEDFGIPIIDIFYDGTGNPNRVLIPHLHYLRDRGSAGGHGPLHFDVAAAQCAIEGGAHHGEHGVVAVRLLQEAFRAAGKHLGGAAFLAVPAGKEDLHRGIDLHQVIVRLCSVHARHDHVEHDEVDPPAALAECLDAAHPVFRLDHRISRPLQYSREDPAHAVLVIHDQDRLVPSRGRPVGRTGSTARPPQAGKLSTNVEPFPGALCT